VDRGRGPRTLRSAPPSGLVWLVSWTGSRRASDSPPSSAGFARAIDPGGGFGRGAKPPSEHLEPPPPAERALAQAERLRRHLEQLVFADPLEALLEVHGAGRGELGGVVRGGRAH